MNAAAESAQRKLRPDAPRATIVCISMRPKFASVRAGLHRAIQMQDSRAGSDDERRQHLPLLANSKEAIVLGVGRARSSDAAARGPP